MEQQFQESPIGFGHSRRRTFYNREAFDYIIGKILGDGHINKKNQLEIDQKEYDYTAWNQVETQRFGLSSNDAKISAVQRKRLNKETLELTPTTSHRCYSSALFGDFRKKFYVLKTPGDPTYGRGSPWRKAYPEELKEWFTSPYSLAVLYMDDGGIQQESPFISTGEVSTQEVLFLKEIFEDNFGLEFSLTKVAKEKQTSTYVYKGLHLKRSSRRRFFELVSPTVMQVPCMRYKLDFVSNIQNND